MLEGYDIGQIRFLPMDSKVEFKAEEDVRNFLEKGLAEMDGEYYYRTQAMLSVDADTLVLFQYKGGIVGYGIFEERVDLPEPVIDEGLEYNGYYNFYIESIHNITKISAKEFSKINPDFKRFGNYIGNMKLEYLDELLLLLQIKQKDFEYKV